MNNLIMSDVIQNVSQNIWQEPQIFQSYTQLILEILNQYDLF